MHRQQLSQRGQGKVYDRPHRGSTQVASIEGFVNVAIDIVHSTFVNLL